MSDPKASAGRNLTAAVLLVLALLPWPHQAATLSICCGAVGKELSLCRSGAEA